MFFLGCLWTISDSITADYIYTLVLLSKPPLLVKPRSTPCTKRGSGPCAGQNQFRHHIGSTYVPVQGDRITGFVTVSSGEIAAKTMPKALRIAPLAVDERFQDHDIGQLLLGAMLELALEMRNRVDCNARSKPVKPARSTTLLRRHCVISHG